MASSPHPVILPSKHATTTPPTLSLPSQGNFTYHTLISHPETPTNSLTAGIVVCPPHTGELKLHRHSQAEIYHVLSGRGTVFVDGVAHEVERGSTVFIPGDAEHGVLNKEGEEELRWFYVFATDGFGDVKYRYSHEADRESGKEARA